VTELASTKLQAAPRGVWTVRDGEFDKLIIVSYNDSTLVLSINASGVEEIKTSGLQVVAVLWSRFEVEATHAVCDLCSSMSAPSTPLSGARARSFK